MIDGRFILFINLYLLIVDILLNTQNKYIIFINSLLLNYILLIIAIYSGFNEFKYLLYIIWAFGIFGRIKKIIKN